MDKAGDAIARRTQSNKEVLLRNMVVKLALNKFLWWDEIASKPQMARARCSNRTVRTISTGAARIAPIAPTDASSASHANYYNNHALTATAREMESWKSGRRDLFDQLTKVCDRIGEDLEAGTFIVLACLVHQLQRGTFLASRFTINDFMALC